MNNDTLIEKYRERLLTVHCATVAIVSFVEIFAYFIFVHLGKHPLSPVSRYLWLSVILPICINTVTHFAARKICHSANVKTRLKNNSVIYAAFVTTFVVSIIHRDYIVTSCAFVFPVILSAMYNDMKILRESVVLAIVSLTATVTVLFAEQKLDLTGWLNVVILYGFVAVSYLSGDLSIKFSQSNFDLIQEQADENDKLETILDLDPMTQLFNHETFYEKLGLAMEERIKNGGSCSLAMIDIDDFKKVNDTYGHNAGDDVLIALADILRNICSEEDSPCRYGGEEFGVIFCNKTVNEAKELVAFALKQFSEHEFDFANEHYTFSCGISAVMDGDIAETVFDRADDLLYKSKHTGKNRITIEK